MCAKEGIVVKQHKNVVLSILIVSLMLLCFGCGKEEKTICKVGNETLDERDMTAYGIMFAREHGLYSGDDFEAIYEDGMTYEEYYKNQLRQDVVETLLIYCKAKEEKVDLDKDEKKQLKEKMSDIIDAYGNHWLNDNKLNKDIIERACTIRMVSDKYLQQEMANAGGKSKDSEKDRYVKLHQVQFMTVRMKKNGLVDTSLDGDVQNLPMTDIAKVKKEAEDFASRAQAEQSITVTRKDYNSYMNQIENYYKYDDLDEEVREAIDTMQQGEISNVVHFKYGYCVFELLEADAKDFSQSLFEYEYSEEEKVFKENWIKELKLQIAKNGEITEDIDYWNQAKMSDYIH